MSVKGVLLDVDGTLIDSNEAHARSWSEAFASEGIELAPEVIQPLIGMGGDKLIPRVTGLEPLAPVAKRISQRRGRVFREIYLPHLKAFRSATALVRRFHSEGILTCIATSAQAEELKPMLARLEIEECLSGIVCGDDVAQSKPDGDIILAALDQLQLKPSEAIMIGDTSYDIDAASKAGVLTVAFRCGGWEDADLSGALTIYDGPDDLLTNYSVSPFGDHSGSIP